MHIRGARIHSFKRFTDLTIESLLPSAKLTVLCGPNGSGKSSLFDAFRLWHSVNAATAGGWDENYHQKRTGQLAGTGYNNQVQLEFIEPLGPDTNSRRDILYFRSAYRHEADFSASQIHRAGSILDAPKVTRMIEMDVKVADNYQRMVSATVDALYSGAHDADTVESLKRDLIGPIKDSMSRLFGDLVLSGLGDPQQGGSFFFEKGAAVDFHYRNISGGEKAAFDLILDIIAKRDSYPNAVWCIDEPELHMNTRLQAQLLEEMLRLIPDPGQLWVATHSIGMMRKARDLQRQQPENVQFLDFEGRDFDNPVTIAPGRVTREFWTRTLRIALDDLADLVAPEHVILCEGVSAKGSGRGEFDASCYRTIFGKAHPEVDFISVGNETDVSQDRIGIGRSIQTLARGTRVTRLVDRDSKTSQEITQYQHEGIRVLSRRHLEAYLLDDEIIGKLCDSVGQAQKTETLIAKKRELLEQSSARGNPTDDLKSIAGELQVEVRKILGLTSSGSNADAFLRDIMAPLVTPETKTYAALGADVFDK